MVNCMSQIGMCSSDVSVESSSARAAAPGELAPSLPAWWLVNGGASVRPTSQTSVSTFLVGMVPVASTTGSQHYGAGRGPSGRSPAPPTCKRNSARKGRKSLSVGSSLYT